MNALALKYLVKPFEILLIANPTSPAASEKPLIKSFATLKAAPIFLIVL